MEVSQLEVLLVQEDLLVVDLLVALLEQLKQYWPQSQHQKALHWLSRPQQPLCHPRQQFDPELTPVLELGLPFELRLLDQLLRELDHYIDPSVICSHWALLLFAQHLLVLQDCQLL
jgi:hypothetical protein